jgi:hypothetical protein
VRFDKKGSHQADSRMFPAFSSVLNRSRLDMDVWRGVMPDIGKTAYRDVFSY